MLSWILACWLPKWCWFFSSDIELHWHKIMSSRMNLLLIYVVYALSIKSYRKSWRQLAKILEIILIQLYIRLSPEAWWSFRRPTLVREKDKHNLTYQDPHSHRTIVWKRVNILKYQIWLPPKISGRSTLWNHLAQGSYDLPPFKLKTTFLISCSINGIHNESRIASECG